MRIGRRRNGQPRRDGCGFLILTCFFTCFFLILNSGVVSRFYYPLAQFGPEFLLHPRVVQMAMFLGPVLLIFVEWWLVDLAVDLVAALTGRWRSSSGSNSPHESDIL